MDTETKVFLCVLFAIAMSVASCHDVLRNQEREQTARACLAAGNPSSACGFVKQVACE